MVEDKQNFIKDLELDLADAVSFSDINLGLKSIVLIEKILSEDESSLDETTKGKLVFLLHRFQWIVFSNLGDETCLELVENFLQIPFEFSEYSLTEQIAKKITQIGLEENQISFMDKMIESLEKSNMKLGNKNITVEGKQVEPTIGNFLKDFASMPTKSTLKTNLDEVKFTTYSKNFGLLSENDKRKLLEIIKIYNSIKNNIIKYKSLPVTTNEAEAFKDFNLYKWLPGLDFEEDSKTIKTSSPIENREDLSGVGVSIAGKDSLSYLNSQKVKLPESVTSTTPQTSLKPSMPPVVPKVKPVNLAEVMKNKDKIDLGSGSGIRFGGAGGSIQDTVNSKQDMVNSRQQTVHSTQSGAGSQGIKPLEIKSKAQVDIEKKLEDLKKRKKPQIS